MSVLPVAVIILSCRLCLPFSWIHICFSGSVNWTSWVVVLLYANSAHHIFIGTFFNDLEHNNSLTKHFLPWQCLFSKQLVSAMRLLKWSDWTVNYAMHFYFLYIYVSVVSWLSWAILAHSRYCMLCAWSDSRSTLRVAIAVYQIC